MPIEAHGVPHPTSEEFHLGAVGPHPKDGGVAPLVGLTYVAGSAHWHVQLTVWAEPDELPAVMAPPREAVVDHDGLRRTVQAGFDVV
jgi:hypothetical protein